MDSVFFGSDTYLSWLKDGLARADSDTMERFLLDVNRYAESQLRGQLPPDQAEDVVMAVDCALLTRIADFLQTAESYSPYQRQRWLKTVIRNAMLDYLEANAFGNSWRDRKQTGESAAPQILSWEAYTQEQDLSDGLSLEEQVIDQSSSALLEHLISEVCSLRGEADSLIAFLYHNIVFFLASDAEKKGKPEETAQKLNGKTLGELRDALPEAIYAVSGYAVPERCFRRLDERLEGLRDKRFSYDAKKISASVSYIKKRVRERSREEHG